MVDLGRIADSMSNCIIDLFVFDFKSEGPDALRQVNDLYLGSPPAGGGMLDCDYFKANDRRQNFSFNWASLLVVGGLGGRKFMP